MKKIAFNQDRNYPFTGVTHIREVARAILVNDEMKIAIHRIYRDDRFCNQGYFETPGGGVDEDETPETAVIRECLEETGVRAEIVAEIGEVDDFYNLIGRENHNFYYLCKAVGSGEKHFVSHGDSFIQETLWVGIDDAIKMYEGMEDTFVAGLVKERELPILKIAKRLIEEELIGK